jgi:hypothetical protein
MGHLHKIALDLEETLKKRRDRVLAFSPRRQGLANLLDRVRIRPQAQEGRIVAFINGIAEPRCQVLYFGLIFQHAKATFDCVCHAHSPIRFQKLARTRISSWILADHYTIECGTGTKANGSTGLSPRHSP